MKVRTLILLAGLLGASGLACADEDLIERGEYLVHAGGCITCHTDKKGHGPYLAGGRALKTLFGTFYTPNITPDPETGIGRWSDDDFVRAFREGVNPKGKNLYPAFPYTSYTGITRGDLLAIKAYLFSLPPTHHPNRPHDLPWYLSFRWLVSPWKWLNFEPGVFKPDPARSAAWNRGAYLVRHLGHCGECHTPRNWMGGLERDRALAGNPEGPEGGKVPDITPDRKTGIGTWSASDIDYFLESGMLPDGDFAGGAMSDVIDDNTSDLTADDRKAIAEYLKSVPPLPSAAGDGGQKKGER
jgi:mono/diheme cytochrome c family protein